MRCISAERFRLIEPIMILCTLMIGTLSNQRFSKRGRRQMASIIDDPNGRKRIEFTLDGKRKTLRLGEMSDRDAETIERHIRNLLASKKSGRVEDITLDWLSSADKCDDNLH